MQTLIITFPPQWLQTEKSVLKTRLSLARHHSLQGLTAQGCDSDGYFSHWYREFQRRNLCPKLISEQCNPLLADLKSPNLDNLTQLETRSETLRKVLDLCKCRVF